MAQQKEREAALEEAKKYVVTEDTSLPRATKVNIGNKDIELGNGTKKGVRVKVCGRDPPFTRAEAGNVHYFVGRLRPYTVLYFSWKRNKVG